MGHHPLVVKAFGEKRQLADWCREKGLPIHLVRSRIRRGWSHERALIEPKMSVGRPPKTHQLADQTVTASQMASKLRLSRSGLHARLRRLGCMEDAVAAGKRRNQKRVVRHAGLALTLRQWSQVIGVAASTLYRRRRRGLPLDEVLSPAD